MADNVADRWQKSWRDRWQHRGKVLAHSCPLNVCHTMTDLLVERWPSRWPLDGTHAADFAAHINTFSKCKTFSECKKECNNGCSFACRLHPAEASAGGARRVSVSCHKSAVDLAAEATKTAAKTAAHLAIRLQLLRVRDIATILP